MSTGLLALILAHLGRVSGPVRARYLSLLSPGDLDALSVAVEAIDRALRDEKLRRIEHDRPETARTQGPTCFDCPKCDESRGLKSP